MEDFVDQTRARWIENEEYLEPRYGRYFRKVEAVFNIHWRLLHLHFWTLENLVVLTASEKLAAQAVYKGQFALFTAYELVRRGMFGVC